MSIWPSWIACTMVKAWWRVRADEAGKGLTQHLVFWMRHPF